MDYEWSSYPRYLKPPAARPVWLAVQRVMGELGWSRDTEEARQAIACHLETRRWEVEDQAVVEQIRHDWCLGGEAFRQSLLAQVEHAHKPNHVGAEWQESQLQKAERLV